MNKLPHEERTKILHLLCEGMGIRAVTRLTGASKNTVAKLLIDAGKACAAYHDANVGDVKAARVQVNKIWSFTYSKQKNVAGAEAAPDHAGDTWTWIAIEADSKMIVSYLVGAREAEYDMWFMDDLASRLASQVQLTSDGHSFSKRVKNYAHAVALHIMYYNFVRLHTTLRVTPAMAAGVADRLWEIADIAMLVEEAETKPARRGPRKKSKDV